MCVVYYVFVGVCSVCGVLCVCVQAQEQSQKHQCQVSSSVSLHVVVLIESLNKPGAH